ncbi:MAG TPA: FxsA family protein [Micromonosporaceae bacterium]|jgi:UPF0716 protein FxsA|nr:FxsA family protein [Micromonosporaceae bacterium]
MRRFPIAVLAVFGLAVAEIAVLVLVVKAIGLGWALLLMLATSLLGGWLLRREGSRAWRRFRDAAQAGRPPGGEASRGLVGLLSALLLAVPGFLTDLLGLALLVPPVRTGAAGLVQRSAERRLSPSVVGDLFGPRRVRVNVGRDGPEPSGAEPVIEGEILD